MHFCGIIYSHWQRMILNEHNVFDVMPHSPSPAAELAGIRTRNPTFFTQMQVVSARRAVYSLNKRLPKLLLMSPFALFPCYVTKYFSTQKFWQFPLFCSKRSWKSNWWSCCRPLLAKYLLGTVSRQTIVDQHFVLFMLSSFL